MFYWRLILLFMLSHTSYPQTTKAIDSLARVFNASQHDTLRILIIKEIALEYVKNRLNPDTCAELSRQILELAQKAKYKQGEGWAHYVAGLGCYANHKYPEALKKYQQGLAVFEQTKEYSGMALVLNGIGSVYMKQSNYPLSLKNYQRGLQVSEQIGNKTYIARAFNNIGAVYNQQAKYSLALEYFQKSFAIRKQIQDIPGMVTNLNNIGIIHLIFGDYPSALQTYQQALEIQSKTDDTKGIILILNNLGSTYDKMGRYAEALEQYQKSFKFAQEVGDVSAIATSLHNIGNIYLYQGKDQVALEYYQKSLKIKEEVGDRRSVAKLMDVMGTVHSNNQNDSLAMEYYQKSLALKKEIGDKQGEAFSLANIASVYSTKDLNAALQHYQESFRIYEEIGDKSEISRVLHNIGSIYAKQNNYPLALECYKKSLVIQEEIGYDDSSVKILTGLAKIYQNQGNQLNSIQYAEKALKIAQSQRDIQDVRDINNLAETLYQSYKQIKNYQKALQYHEIYKSTSDTLFNVEKSEAIVRLETDAQIAKKKQEIDFLKEQQDILRKERQYQTYLTYGISLILIIVVIMSFSIYRAKRQLQLQKDKISNQNQILETQANELQNLNTQKDRLFAIIGHDLRSPISSLQGVVSLLVEGNLSREEFNSLSSRLLIGIKSTVFTLNNILNWALSQMNNLEMSKQFVLLREIAVQNLNFLGILAEDKQITIHNYISEDAQVWADENQINLVFRNLISNAIKFTPQGSTITLSATQQGNYREVSIQDNGVGMDTKTIEQILGKGYVSPSYGTKGEKGTGIGLTLCKEIVEKNGGSMHITSEVDVGTRVSFRLPFAAI